MFEKQQLKIKCPCAPSLKHRPIMIMFSGLNKYYQHRWDKYTIKISISVGKNSEQPNTNKICV